MNDSPIIVLNEWLTNYYEDCRKVSSFSGCVGPGVQSAFIGFFVNYWIFKQFFIYGRSYGHIDYIVITCLQKFPVDLFLRILPIFFYYKPLKDYHCPQGLDKTS